MAHIGPPSASANPLPLGGPLTTFGILSAPGFSSVAIPIPHGSLYLNPMVTIAEPAPVPSAVNNGPAHRVLSPSTSSSSSFMRRALPAPPKKPQFNGAYTLLIVNDSPVDRKILGKICERWGQPYELAENGHEAVEMYKEAPDKFRCILMDLVMPVMDGFEATKLIREFEEASWNAFSTSNPSSHHTRPVESAPKPIRRSVIIALVPSYSIAGLRQRIADTGFDLSVCRPFHMGTLCNMFFSGPGMNVVGLYGGVDDCQLKAAGYPLQIMRRKPSSIGEKEIGEALGRAVS